MTDELLPCPFCGGVARPTAHLTYSWFAPVCTLCGARGPSVRIPESTGQQEMRELLNKADSLWNTRHTPDVQQATIDEALIAAESVCLRQTLEPECPERAQYCAEAIRELRAKMLDDPMPVKYVQIGGVVYAVYGSSSINCVEALQEKTQAAIDAALEKVIQIINSKYCSGFDTRYGLSLIRMINDLKGTNPLAEAQAEIEETQTKLKELNGLCIYHEGFERELQAQIADLTAQLAEARGALERFAPDILDEIDAMKEQDND